MAERFRNCWEFMDVVPDIPDRLRRFILKASHFDPDRRYRNMHQPIEDLVPLVKQMETQQARSPVSRKMSMLFLMYDESHQSALNLLMNDFSNRLQDLGVLLKVSDFGNIDPDGFV